MFAIPNVPDTLAREIYAELCRALPPSPDDTPESHAIRQQLAMTAVAHLLPENVAEGFVAVQIVTAQTYARDALRQASHGTPAPDPGRIPGLGPGTSADPDKLRQCRAWAASMMRQADSGIRTLLRMQAERQKAEDAARPAAMERAGYWFRSASAPDPDTAHAESTAPPQVPAEASPPTPEPPKLEYGAMTPGERYVTLYPDRAARIIAARGHPAQLAFPPPDPAVITELLSSHSPLIRTLRHTMPDPLAA